jgi:hypothetical protein
MLLRGRTSAWQTDPRSTKSGWTMGNPGNKVPVMGKTAAREKAVVRLSTLRIILRLLPILALAFLTGCADLYADPEQQNYWVVEKAKRDYEQNRLQEIYRKEFISSFLEAWHGGGSVSDGDIFETSDPDGTAAYNTGHHDGFRAGREAFEENLKNQFKENQTNQVDRDTK